MAEIKFHFVDELPAPPHKDWKPYVEAARARPGHWLEVAPADKHGNLVTGFKTRHQLQVVTRNGIVYIRQPRSTDGVAK